MSQELIWLESEADRDGPYFLGKQFSAVDCTLLPWFIRLYVLKHYRGFEMPKECRCLVAWYVLRVLDRTYVIWYHWHMNMVHTNVYLSFSMTTTVLCLITGSWLAAVRQCSWWVGSPAFGSAHDERVVLPSNLDDAAPLQMRASLSCEI